MFSQEKTGKFIAECRKEKGLTQRQLAEALNLSDKTISKWETGNGTPDSSIMERLCELLGIDVNELLSGERLSADSYHGKAEENMMELMKQSETEKKGSRVWTVVGTVAGLALCVLFSVSSAGLTHGIWYIDMPSLVCIVGFLLASLGLSGQMRYFFDAFSFCFGKKRNAGGEADDEREKAAYALRFAEKISVLSGIFGMVHGTVMVIGNLENIEYLGPNMAVACLTVFYGILFAIVFTVLEGRVRK